MATIQWQPEAKPLTIFTSCCYIHFAENKTISKQQGAPAFAEYHA